MYIYSISLNHFYRVRHQKRFSPKWVPYRWRRRQKRSDLNGPAQSPAELLDATSQKREEDLNANTGSYNALEEKFDKCVRVFRAQGNTPMLQHDRHNQHNAGDASPSVRCLQIVAMELNLNNNFSGDKATPASDGDSVGSDKATNASILAAAGDETAAKSIAQLHDANDANDAAEDTTAGFLDHKSTQVAQRLLGLVTMAAEPKPLGFKSRESLPHAYGALLMAFVGMIQVK